MSSKKGRISLAKDANGKKRREENWVESSEKFFEDQGKARCSVSMCASHQQNYSHWYIDIIYDEKSAQYYSCIRKWELGYMIPLLCSK